MFRKPDGVGPSLLHLCSLKARTAELPETEPRLCCCVLTLCPLSLLQCKLEFHACSTGKSLSSLCDGPCPCLPEPEPPKPKAEKSGEWTRVQGVRAGLRGQACLGCQEPGLRQSCSGPWREHELTWQVRSPASAIKERKKSRETLNTNLLDQGVRRLLLNGGLTLAWEGKVFSI